MAEMSPAPSKFSGLLPGAPVNLISNQRDPETDISKPLVY
jgi:hypothetical protein